jgi:phosphatidate cytidylyltransferase
MSNMVTRILSGLVLIGILTFCIWKGPDATLIAIGVLGPLVIDELITNFYSQSRSSKRYILAQSIYCFGFYFFNFYQISQSSFNFWISAGIFLNIFLMVYLFLIHRKSDSLLQVFRMTSWLTSFYVLIPLLCLSYIIHVDNWRNLFIGLMLLNFMVDTGAYFSGKQFGRHKLWEAVSPKKTVEGLIGGVFFSVLFTSLFWNHFVAQVTPLTVLFFIVVACCSQIGDLAQSKLKRQFEIKDSSSLIPGHGGVYDRIDSLLFVSPFYSFYLMATFH